MLYLSPSLLLSFSLPQSLSFSFPLLFPLLDSLSIRVWDIKLARPQLHVMVSHNAPVSTLAVSSTRKEKEGRGGGEEEEEERIRREKKRVRGYNKRMN